MRSGTIILGAFLFFAACLILWRPTKDMFAAVNTALTGAPDMNNINVQQPATEILKILARDPNRYVGFFNNLNVYSSKNDAKYPLYWPLTAGDINNRLAFGPVVEQQVYDSKNLMVTTNPQTDEYIWFTGDNGPIRAYSPSAPTNAGNYLGNWTARLQFGMCNNYGGPLDSTGGPYYGALCS